MQALQQLTQEWAGVTAGHAGLVCAASGARGGCRILLLDEDESLRDTLGLLLEREGHAAFCTANAAQARHWAAAHTPDLFIVDEALRSSGAYDCLAPLQQTPPRLGVITLYAGASRAEPEDANSLRKPFGAWELLARLRTVLSRQWAKARLFDNAVIDFQRRQVLRDGCEVPLTRREFDLLLYFLHHPNRPLSRSRIMSAVWGPGEVSGARAVEASVSQLRRNLEADPAMPRHLLTMRDGGYLFVDGQGASSADCGRL